MNSKLETLAVDLVRFNYALEQADLGDMPSIIDWRDTLKEMCEEAFAELEEL